MPTILRSSLQFRIMDFCETHYPVTVSELARGLHVSERRLLGELMKMQARGLAELEVLPDKTYVRLLVARAPARGKGRGGPDGGPPREGKRGKGEEDDLPGYS